MNYSPYKVYFYNQQFYSNFHVSLEETFIAWIVVNVNIKIPPVGIHVVTFIVLDWFIHVGVKNIGCEELLLTWVGTCASDKNNKHGT